MDYAVFDGDNHLYETEDALLRFLPPGYEGAIRFVKIDGRTKLAVKNQITEFIPNPTFEVVAKPGAHMEYYRGHNPEGKTRRELGGDPMRSISAFREPEARVAVLDDLGLDACVVYPTLVNLVEAHLIDDPELTQAVIHAYNEWAHDVWTFNFRNRIFATPVINLSTLEGGIAELEWAVDHGAKMVLMRPAPVGTGRGPCSPFLPQFDPYWARVEELRMPVAFHASNTGYERYSNEWEGSQAREFLPFKPKAFQTLSMGQRAITDTMFSAIAHGMLSRFPGVRLYAVENGSTWVGRALEDMATIYARIPQEFPENPVEVFRRQVYVNPFWEDPIDDLIGHIGADRIVFGSDWPHPEGLDEPLVFADYCGKLGLLHDDMAKIMGGNLAELMDVQLTVTGPR